MSDDKPPRAWLRFSRTGSGPKNAENQFTLGEDGTGVLSAHHTFDKAPTDQALDQGVWITFFKDGAEVASGVASARIAAPGTYHAVVRHASGTEVSTGKLIILGAIGPCSTEDPQSR